MKRGLPTRKTRSSSGAHHAPTDGARRVVGRALIVLGILTTLVACSQAEFQAAEASAVASPKPAHASISPLHEQGGDVMWRPKIGDTWQWQLDTGDIDLDVDADVFDVDGFDVTGATVEALHALGRHVICYIDVGGWESYRADAADFPEEVLGRPIDGWPEERWLDVRRLDALRPIMAARFDMCRDKGADAVEADQVEAYAEPGTGFEISKYDQLAYNRMLADLAHERGMSIALKNAAELVPQLVDDFDFAVVEECFIHGECERYRPFIEHGKAVLHVEYDVTLSDFCARTRDLGFSSIRKNLKLDAWREACPLTSSENTPTFRRRAREG